MPYRPLGRHGEPTVVGAPRPQIITAEQIVGGLIFGEEIVIGGGLQGIIRSELFVPGVSGWAIFGDGTAEFNDVIVRGDIVSANWDGANPADLTTRDLTATQGFYLDSSVGSAQFAGEVFITPSGPESVLRLFRAAGIGYYTLQTNTGGNDAYLGFAQNNANFELYNLLTGGNIDIGLKDSGGTARVRLRIAADGDTQLIDNATNTRMRIEENAQGDILWYAAGSGICFMWDESAKALLANDQVEGPVEIFPKGTLVTMATVTDGVDQATTGSEVIYDTQTIGGLAANAQVYVDVTITVLWKSFGYEALFCAPAVMGSRVGELAWGGNPQSSTAVAGAAALTSTEGTGNTGGQSATHGHVVGAASWNTQDGGVGHSHPGPALNETTGNADAGHVHSGPAHNHWTGDHQHGLSLQGYHTQTIRWCGAHTANGSGQVTIGISAGSSSAGGVMETTTIAYAIWRR